MKNYKKITSTSKLILDASNTNWVDRFCPSWSLPFLKLSRLDRPIGTWLLLLPCWWGSALAMLSHPSEISGKDIWILLSCVFGSILMRGAGCTWNDISDRKYDAKVERTKLRPIPSGQISVKTALLWMAFQAISSLLILLTFNSFAIVIGLSAAIPVAIYPFAKRFTWWPQLFLGIAFNWGILLSYSAHVGRLDLSPFLLYLSAIAWTIFYDTIYAFQDAKDDEKIGLKSTALFFGVKHFSWLRLCILASIFLMVSAFYFIETVINLKQVITIVVTIGAFYFHLYLQLKQLNINDAKVCLKLFKSNRNSGLIVFFGFMLAVFLN